MRTVTKFVNKIVHGDCLATMRKLPDQSIDLIITSPPYNIRNSTGGGLASTGAKGKWGNAELCKGYEGHTDDMPYDQYVQWQRDCLTEMLRLIPETGAIFYNHKWRVQDGLIQDRREILDQFPVRQIIIWQRAGGINFNDQYFLPTYEVIYLIAKPKFRLRSQMCKYGDVWKIPQENRGNPHPAPFPFKLPDRIISCIDAEIVLDPFMGSGTTALAAIQNGRKWIGIEQSKKYVALANKRIQEFMDACGKYNLFGRGGVR